MNKSDFMIEEQSLRFIEAIENSADNTPGDQQFKDVEEEKAFNEINEVWETADLLNEDDINGLFEIDGNTKEESSSFTAWLTSSLIQRSVAFLSVIVVATLSIFGYLYFGTSDRYVVQKGMQQSIFFQDGTKVTAGSHSKFTVRDGWGGRSVQLDRGNIFFEVAPNRSKPFIVSTPNSRIQVVGTAFNVYSRNGHDEVVVAHGKVQVSSAVNESQTRILTKNQKLTIKKQVIELETSVNTELEISWITGALTFDNETLENIVSRMADYYEQDIHINNANLRNLRLSGNFSTKNVDDFLAALQLVSNIEIDRSKRSEIIIQ